MVEREWRWEGEGAGRYAATILCYASVAAERAKDFGKHNPDTPASLRCQCPGDSAVMLFVAPPQAAQGTVSCLVAQVTTRLSDKPAHETAALGLHCLLQGSSLYPELFTHMHYPTASLFLHAPAAHLLIQVCTP